jgi:hypothetical protein
VEETGSTISIPQPTGASPSPQDLVATVPHGDNVAEEPHLHRGCSRRKLTAITIIALVVEVASVVGTTCGQASSGCLRQESNANSVDPAVNGAQPNVVDTSAPVVDPPIVQSAILDYINNVTLTKMTISTSTANRSPEASALRWLLYDNNFTHNESSSSTLVSQWQLRQRYAIATLYIQNVNPLDMNARHECDWSGISCQTINVNGTNTTVVTEILLRDMEWTGSLSADLGLLTTIACQTPAASLLLRKQLYGHCSWWYMQCAKSNRLARRLLG